MKRILTAIVTFFVLSPAFVSADTSQKIFSKANQALEAGRWDEALQQYQSLIGQGFGGPSLYYNLGNVHYRRGERGKAILWYERAKRTAPRDADITFNLDLSRSHLKDGGDNPLQRAALYFTSSELGWSFTVLTVLFFGLLGATFLGKLRADTGPRAALWFSGTALLITGLWLGGNIFWSERAVAVVVAPPGEVRNGPGQEYAVGFTIPEGSKVLVLNQRPAWTQVGVPEQGLKGWMPTSDVELISGWEKSSG